MKRVYTDKNGTVFIPKQVYRLKLYEEPSDEYIYINLDLTPSPKDQDIGDFFESLKIHNPISYLKGMIITNHGSTIVRDWGTLPDDAIFAFRDNWGTFLKEEEIITVKLEKW